MALQVSTSSRSQLLRPVRARPARVQVRTQALFGWGKNSEAGGYDEKEEQFRLQQELLEARKSGSMISEANQRRRKVSETLAERKAVRAAEREALSRGEMPDTLKTWKPYSSKRDEEATSGIVVPLLPFGINKYDEGERFDLRSPYADDGWVDPEETDMWAGFKRFGSKFLNFGGKDSQLNKDLDSQRGKPIVWASQYSKMAAEKKAKKEDN